jgi:hypothetical protein
MLIVAADLKLDRDQRDVHGSMIRLCRVRV